MATIGYNSTVDVATEPRDTTTPHFILDNHGTLTPSVNQDLLKVGYWVPGTPDNTAGQVEIGIYRVSTLEKIASAIVTGGNPGVNTAYEADITGTLLAGVQYCIAFRIVVAASVMRYDTGNSTGDRNTGLDGTTALQSTFTKTGEGLTSIWAMYATTQDVSNTTVTNDISILFNVKSSVLNNSNLSWSVRKNVQNDLSVVYDILINSTPNSSLGGAISTTEVVTATLQNLFDNVSGSESVSGTTEYRCVYIKNENSTDTMNNTKIWLQSNTPSTETTVAIGLGSSAINGIEQTISNESTAPSGISFSSPSSEGSALSIGNIPAGQHKAIWIRRIVNSNSSAYSGDNFILRIKCDSGA